MDTNIKTILSWHKVNHIHFLYVVLSNIVFLVFSINKGNFMLSIDFHKVPNKVSGFKSNSITNHVVELAAGTAAHTVQKRN